MKGIVLLLVLFVAWQTVWGYRKGALRVLYSLAAWFLALLFMTWATPCVTDWLTENTTIDERIEQAVEEMTVTELESLMPEALAQKLLEESGIYESTARLAMRVLAAAIVLVITILISKALSSALGLVDYLPLIGGVNHLLGGVAGFLKAIFLAGLLCCLILYFL